MKKCNLALLALLLLLLTSIGARALYISQPTLDFNPTRQYRAALMARGMYLEATEGVPSWRLEVAEANSKAELTFEPPVMENIAALSYLIPRI